MLLRNIDEVTIFHNSGWHFGWVSNYEVVDVIIVDDVGDSASGLLHLL